MQYVRQSVFTFCFNFLLAHLDYLDYFVLHLALPLESLLIAGLDESFCSVLKPDLVNHRTSSYKIALTTVGCTILAVVSILPITSSRPSYNRSLM